jgi:hypothetical protein
MAHRTFEDSDGTNWEVWEVRPRVAYRRPHRSHGEVLAGLGRVGPELAHGWLAFQSHEQKRRLAPIPVGWQDGDDDALRALCHKAKKVGGRRARLIE